MRARFNFFSINFYTNELAKKERETGFFVLAHNTLGSIDYPVEYCFIFSAFFFLFYTNSCFFMADRKTVFG
jgi:hypothetical protein